MRALLRSFQFLAVATCAVSLASATTGCGGGGSDGGACCKTCSTGKACGDSCISRDYQCHEGNGCACDAALALNPKPGTPVVEAFTYIGPTGLRYGEGVVSGNLDASPTPLEVEVGKATPLYWEHVYLGELVPAPDTDIITFNVHLQNAGCTILTRELVGELIRLKNANGVAASLQDLEAMGFRGVETLHDKTSTSALATDVAFLKNFGSGLERHAGCR